MPRAHCVFLIQPSYGSRARKKPWADGVYGGGPPAPTFWDHCLESVQSSINKGSSHRRVSNATVSVFFITIVMPLMMSTCTVFSWVLGYQTTATCRYLGLSTALYGQWIILSLSSQDCLKTPYSTKHQCKIWCSSRLSVSSSLFFHRLLLQNSFAPGSLTA